jgi:hypothetical protein
LFDGEDFEKLSFIDGGGNAVTHRVFSPSRDAILAWITQNQYKQNRQSRMECRFYKQF